MAVKKKMDFDTKLKVFAIIFILIVGSSLIFWQIQETKYSELVQNKACQICGFNEFTDTNVITRMVYREWLVECDGQNIIRIEEKIKLKDKWGNTYYEDKLIVDCYTLGFAKGYLQDINMEE